MQNLFCDFIIIYMDNILLCHILNGISSVMQIMQIGYIRQGYCKQAKIAELNRAIFKKKYIC